VRHSSKEVGVRVSVNTSKDITFQFIKNEKILFMKMERELFISELRKILDGLDKVKVVKFKYSIYYGLLKDEFTFTQKEILEFARKSGISLERDGYIHLLNYSRFEELVIIDERVKEKVLLYYL